MARAKGFLMASCTPLTRSSYHAGDDFVKLRASRDAKLKAAREEKLKAAGDNQVNG